MYRNPVPILKKISRNSITSHLSQVLKSHPLSQLKTSATRFQLFDARLGKVIQDTWLIAYMQVLL